MADVFVFGSNLAGKHGKGSALEAHTNHGAVYGVGVGRMGNSYAIPTKGHKLQVLSLETVAWYVQGFIRYARANPDDTFNVVAIGCGLAGHDPAEIAPMFAEAPANVKLPTEFTELYNERLP